MATPPQVACSIRVERSAKWCRKSGRCRDCAASTASSINSSACLDIDRWGSALPRGGVRCCDGLVLILRIDVREAPRVSSCEALLYPNPTGDAQCESIPGEHQVSK